MAEQPLDGVDVHAGLQQMRGDSVAQAVNPPGLGDAGPSFRRRIRALNARRVQGPLGPAGREEPVRGRSRCQEVRNSSSRRTESRVYRSFAPLPCSTRIVMRAESMSVTRRCTNSFTRNPAAYAVASMTWCVRLDVAARIRRTSSVLRMWGIFAGWRDAGIVNVERSRFNVTW